MSSGIKGKESENKFFTIEFFGVTLIISSFIMLICLFFGGDVLFEIGEEIKFFLLGVFGYFSYPFLLSINVIGFMLLLGKKPSKNSNRRVFKLTLLMSLILILFTIITNLKTPNSLSEYLNNAFSSGRNGVNGVVAGGVIFSLPSFVIVKYLKYVGGIISMSLVLLTYFILLIKGHKNRLNNPPKQEVEGGNLQINGNSGDNLNNNSNNGYVNNGFNNGYNGMQPNNLYPNLQPNNPFGQYNNYPNQPINQNSNSGYYYGGFSTPQNENLNNNYNNSPSREEAMKILYGEPQKTYSNEFNRSFTDDKLRFGGNEKPQNLYNDSGMISSPIPKEEPPANYVFEDKSNINIYNDSSDSFLDDYDDANDTDELDAQSDIERYKPQKETNATDFFKKILNKEKVSSTEENISEVSLDTPSINQPKVQEVDMSVLDPQGDYNSKMLIENMPVNYKYKAPPVSLLKKIDKEDDDIEFEMFKADIKNKILTTLEQFDVTTRIAAVHRGPAVTRFDIEVPFGVPISKITKQQNDINLRVEARSPVRMLAPVPGTSYVGIEVPNKKVASVGIRDVVISEKFVNSEDFSLTFALGKDIIGNPIALDLARMPHLLVTGTTGSGKSVCLNTLIISLILKYSPQELRFIIVDPKAVEFEVYAKIPHLYFGEIIKDDIPTTNAMLTWVVDEMNRRYDEFSKCRVKDITRYNERAKKLGERLMPRIVVIIDEFADVMLKDKAGANTKICLIAQKSRASGIHLVLAAQRPSVDIIEGPIKANLSSRIVFRATAPQDSITSLGEVGAEKLLGRGDCLYKSDGMFGVERAMGAYVSDDEIFDVVEYLNNHNEKYFDYNAWAKIKASVVNNEQANDSYSNENNSNVDSKSNGGMDDLSVKAMRLGYEYGGLSTSFIQRKLGIGYPRAAKIIDWLTDNGYISPTSVSGKKKVLLPKEEFEEKYGTDEYGQQ